MRHRNKVNFFDCTYTQTCKQNMETKVTEKLVSHIWRHKLVTELATDNGEQIHIIHPGRNSNTPGCDFQDAVFAINGKTTTGNIEVNVKSSQWQSPGHHRDPKYNSIALHVVWWHDSQAPTLLQDGQAVPSVWSWVGWGGVWCVARGG